MGLSALNWGAILGGFGLFMFGIKFMGDGLKAVAGDALRDYINKATSNRFSALLVGIVLTMIMQSSSATSAITIGLVRAGLMTFEQSAGIILGATIGTTITSLLISIEIDRFAMYIIFAGAMLICFGKKPRSKYNGNVILGFALIFFGMASMGDALASLKELPQFESFALKMSDSPLLAMFTGVGLTALVQSSAATIGVIQKLYKAGAVTFAAALPFMFGANIGTTVTGILASIGGTTAGKRTAALHTVLNIIFTIPGMILLVPYAKLIQALFGHLNPMMQIAAANIVFKTLTTLIALPFVTQLTGLVKRIIPGEDEQTQDINIDEMDEEITNVLPSAALLASRRAIDQMIGLVRDNSLA
ncbi:MAG: Na/Pi cotransporter family protein, partial [Solobacterium sp.]|nr:Na/Pi cotransporter family protein [Solobacterium sp.]